MEKRVFCFLSLMMALNAFTLTLPNGDNVRANDLVLEEGKIVSAKLINAIEITTPLGELLTTEGGEVTFYKSGALKSIELFYTENWDGKRSKIVLKDKVFTVKPKINFYESGALKEIYVYKETPFIFPVENSTGQFYGNIEFYDSGNISELKLRKGFIMRMIEIERVGEKLLIGDYNNNHIQLYANGNLQRAKLEKETTFKTILGDLFAIKGNITFWEDKKIKSFINSDSLVENIAGILAYIQGNSEISFYKSGKIATFYASEGMEFNVGKYTYTTLDDKYNPFIVSEKDEILETPKVTIKDQKLLAPDYFYIKSFDVDGAPCVIFNEYGKYAVYKNTQIYGFSNNYLQDSKDWFGPSYHFQESHSKNDVYIVFFNDEGEPVSYSIEKDGERDTEKILFIKK